MTWNCLATIQSVTMVMVCTGALFQWNHQPLATISRLFLLKDLQKLTQGLHNVLGIYHGPPGNIVHVDQALAVEEGLFAWS
jgi:hypothetical protein